MCGIAVMLGLNGAASEAILQRMVESMQHRGPDGSGIHTAGPVGLGFRRLSILDLSHAADQPMVSDDRQLVLVFNGEIFNYVELRSELEKLGHTFRTTGDTEVLLYAYKEWGRDCLGKLNGMWAFVVHDLRRGVLFGARDRFGIKPLYYYKDKNHIFLASEIKAILRTGVVRPNPNWKVASAYLLRHGLNESNESFYEGIDQIPPGTAFEIDPKGGLKSWRYWSLPEVSSTEKSDPVEEFAALFEDSVRLRMRSDVPVGVCLSGGMDSTAIICAMARQWNRSGQSLHAFSYYASEYDESSYIAETIRMTQAQLHKIESDPLRAWSTLDKVMYFHDEPVHTMSAVIGYELMGLAASEGVKVVLNGQGADEVIGGYSSYFGDYWYTLMKEANLRGAWQEIGKFVRFHGGNQVRTFAGVFSRLMKISVCNAVSFKQGAGSLRRRPAFHNPWIVKDLSEEDYDGAPQSQDGTLDAVLRQSVERWPLPLYLRLEDRNSMAHSVESRLPFLDYRLVSLVFRSAARWKINGPWNKFLLREAMKGRIPEKVRTRVDKMGFPVPQHKWISNAWYDVLNELLSSQSMRERGTYNLDLIRKDLELHREGHVNLSDRFFGLIQFELWSRQNESLGMLAS